MSEGKREGWREEGREGEEEGEEGSSFFLFLTHMSVPQEPMQCQPSISLAYLGSSEEEANFFFLCPPLISAVVLLFLLSENNQHNMLHLQILSNKQLISLLCMHV